MFSILSLIANAMVHRYYWCITFAVFALFNAVAAFAVYRIAHKKEEK